MADWISEDTSSGEWIPKGSPSPVMGKGEQFLTALGGGMYGAALGVGQAGAEIGERLGLVSPETTQSLREKEVERRETMDRLKRERGGEPGLSNLGSWGEFVGQSAPMVLPTGTAGLAAKGLTGALGAGALVGAGAGYTAPLTPQENRGVSTGLGAATGGALGAGTYGAKLAAQAVPKVLKRAETAISDWILPPTGKMTPEDRTIMGNLMKVAPQSAGKFKRGSAQANAVNRNEAVYDTVKMRDEIELPDSVSKEITRGKLPSSQAEMADALSQSTTKQMDWLNQYAVEAGDRNLVASPLSVTQTNPRTNRPTTLMAELDKIINGKGYMENQKRTALYWKNRIESDGTYTPEEITTLMRNLNNDITNIFTGKNTSGDSAEVLGLVANYAKKSMYKMMDGLDAYGTQFADLRKSWGRQSALMDDIYRNLETRAGKEARGSQSVYDILAAEQLIQGKFRQSAMNYAFARARDYFWGPDQAVRNIYKAAEKKVGNQRYSAPEFLQSPRPVQPSSPRQIGSPSWIEGEFTEVPTGVAPRAGGVPAPVGRGMNPFEQRMLAGTEQKQLPAPMRALPESTAMPTGTTPGSTFAGRPAQAPAGMTPEAIEASRRVVNDLPSVRAEKAAKEGARWKTVEKFSKQFGLSVEEAARILDEASQARRR